MPWTAKGKPEGRARVLVTGAGGNVAQSILRALSWSGLASHVVTTDCHPLSAGLFVADRGYVVPRADAPDFSDVMLELIATESIDIVLVGADAEVMPMARDRASLEEKSGAPFVVGDFEGVQYCQDKGRGASWFQEQGVPHPRTALGGDERSWRSLLEETPGPWVVKPRFGFGSDGISVEEHCRGVEVRLADPDAAARLIVQEHIGTDDEEYTAATYLDSREEQCPSIVMRRTLLRGTSYRVEHVDDASLRSTVEDWARRLRLRGPANFQFRMVDGAPVLFEINYRFSGTTSIRAAFGFDDVAMAIRDRLFGETIEVPSLKPGVGLRYWEELYLPGETFESLEHHFQGGNGQNPGPIDPAP